MTLNTAKIIEVLDAANGITRTTEVDRNSSVNLEEVAPYPRDLYGKMTVDSLKAQHLMEAATGGLSTANFPDLLRLGIQYDLFSSYTEKPMSYTTFCRTMPSNDIQEEYGDDEGVGLPPVVAEGQDYPTVSPTIGGGKIIKNFKRGFILEVTEEIQKFDKIGKVRDMAVNLGRAHRMGRDQSAFNVLTTTANYNVLNNNDQAGNNYQTLTFSPTALNTALALMATQKDKKSGQYLGVQPNVLICGPLMERFVRMAIQSTALVRVGNGKDLASDVYGQGQNNPFFGVVNTIVVDPMFGASYQWALVDSSRAIYFQEVEGLTVLNEGMAATSESYLTRDVMRYRTRDWYGVGMRDDRFAFYSDSTTAPLAD